MLGEIMAMFGGIKRGNTLTLNSRISVVQSAAGLVVHFDNITVGCATVPVAELLIMGAFDTIREDMAHTEGVSSLRGHRV